MKKLTVVLLALALLLTGLASGASKPYAGRQMMARDIVHLARGEGWRHRDLIIIVAIALGESNGYVEAWNDNRDANGKLLSRDIGLWQINVLAEHWSEEVEKKLQDPKYNARRARLLWNERRCQPWVAWNTGWVRFPEWWVYTKAEPRRWAPTGRFLHRALRGWANSLVFHMGHKVETAILYGNQYARDFGIKGELVPGKRPEVAAIDWTPVPPKPTAPPADGVGPRPTPAGRC